MTATAAAATVPTIANTMATLVHRQQQQQRQWQQRPLLLVSVVMLTLFTASIQGITEELSPGKCTKVK